MNDSYTLPKDKFLLAKIIDQHCEREMTKLTYRRTLWILAWFYLNGFRRFDVFDPRTARVVPYYLDEDGNMEFQSTKLLSIIDKTTARLNTGGSTSRKMLGSPTPRSCRIAAPRR